jgi:hypothetical protein
MSCPQLASGLVDARGLLQNSQELPRPSGNSEAEGSRRQRVVARYNVLPVESQTVSTRNRKLRQLRTLGPCSSHIAEAVAYQNLMLYNSRRQRGLTKSRSSAWLHDWQKARTPARFSFDVPCSEIRAYTTEVQDTNHLPQTNRDPASAHWAGLVSEGLLVPRAAILAGEQPSATELETFTRCPLFQGIQWYGTPSIRVRYRLCQATATNCHVLSSIGLGLPLAAGPPPVTVGLLLYRSPSHAWCGEIALATVECPLWKRLKLNS